ncbi:Uncharacterized protein BM_BM17401 [Brugia malayi]|uniref:Uncharacterized protein n=1 Tax=Brugia malayi TaxID=6279 RepID=A0A4E9F6Z9_BRUMA|nr:Uncharacterized protein BM_BM17401 [Brugia malayi]VIO92060.1 Uncharacterized protein BM_BM17401 [Brugia malayi]
MTAFISKGCIKIVGAKHDIKIAGAKHDIKIAGAKHDIKIAGAKHDIKIAGAKQDIKIVGAKHDIKIVGAKHDIKIAGAVGKTKLQQSVDIPWINVPIHMAIRVAMAFKEFKCLRYFRIAPIKGRTEIKRVLNKCMGSPGHVESSGLESYALDYSQSLD